MAKQREAPEVAAGGCLVAWEVHVHSPQFMAHFEYWLVVDEGTVQLFAAYAIVRAGLAAAASECMHAQAYAATQCLCRERSCV